MPASERLASRLWRSHASTPATAARNTTWPAMRRMRRPRRSCSTVGRTGEFGDVGLAGLPVRRGVEQAALRPELVQAAGKPERRGGADVAVVDLAVVAHLLDDLVGEVGRQTELGVEGLAPLLQGETEEPLDLGIGGRRPDLVDVGPGEAELLG